MMKIYYPKINESWEKTNRLTLNAYLNLLVYAGADIDEKLIHIETYDIIPCLENGHIIGTKLDGEKKLAHVNGLYHEDFYHEDDKAYKEVLLKKMKNRVTSPIVYLESNYFSTSYNKNEPVPCICCGYEEKKEEFIILNPQTGKYEVCNLKNSAMYQGRKKIIMLNIPGMNRISQIPNNICFNHSIELYRKQMCLYSDRLSHRKMGIKALKAADFVTLVSKELIESQLDWIEAALSEKEWLKDRNKLFLLTLKEIYTLLKEDSIKEAGGLIRELEELNWD